MQKLEVVLQKSPLLESHENELSQLSESLNFDTWENKKNLKKHLSKIFSKIIITAKSSIPKKTSLTNTIFWHTTCQ